MDVAAAALVIAIVLVLVLIIVALRLREAAIYDSSEIANGHTRLRCCRHLISNVQVSPEEFARLHTSMRGG